MKQTIEISKYANFLHDASGASHYDQVFNTYTANQAFLRFIIILVPLRAFKRKTGYGFKTSQENAFRYLPRL